MPPQAEPEEEYPTTSTEMIQEYDNKDTAGMMHSQSSALLERCIANHLHQTPRDFSSQMKIVSMWKWIIGVQQPTLSPTNGLITYQWPYRLPMALSPTET